MFFVRRFASVSLSSQFFCPCLFVDVVLICDWPVALRSYDTLTAVHVMVCDAAPAVRNLSLRLPHRYAVPPSPWQPCTLLWGYIVDLCVETLYVHTALPEHTTGLINGGRSVAEVGAGPERPKAPCRRRQSRPSV